jgi:hypothetical protein
MGASLEEAKSVWDTRKRLLDQNKDLEMGIRVGYDMESIAIDAKTNLQAQTQKMERVQDRLGQINQEANVANRQLGEIKRARAVNKMILYGVLATIATALLVVVVVKFA